MWLIIHLIKLLIQRQLNQCNSLYPEWRDWWYFTVKCMLIDKALPFSVSSGCAGQKFSSPDSSHHGRWFGRCTPLNQAPARTLSLIHTQEEEEEKTREPFASVVVVVVVAVFFVARWCRIAFGLAFLMPFVVSLLFDERNPLWSLLEQRSLVFGGVKTTKRVFLRDWRCCLCVRKSRGNRVLLLALVD